MLNVWEAIGGRWLLDTRLLILFYRLLGARVRLEEGRGGEAQNGPSRSVAARKRPPPSPVPMGLQPAYPAL